MGKTFVGKKDLRQLEIQRKITRLLSSEKGMSTAEIERQMNKSEHTKMKRSTLNYYLSKFENKCVIEREERVDEKSGRPRMIRLTKKFQKTLDETKNREREYRIEFLNLLNKKGGMSKKEFDDLALSKNDTAKDSIEKSSALASIIFSSPGLIEQNIRLSENGKEYLRRQKK